MKPNRLLGRLGAAALVGIMLAGPVSAGIPSQLYWGAWAACSQMRQRVETFQTGAGKREVRLTCIDRDGKEYDGTFAAILGLWVMYTAGLAVLLVALDVAVPNSATRGGSAFKWE